MCPNGGQNDTYVSITLRNVPNDVFKTESLSRALCATKPAENFKGHHTFNKSAGENSPNNTTAKHPWTTALVIILGKFPPIAESVKKKSGCDRSYSLKQEISPINTMLKIYFQPKQMREISPKQHDSDNILEISDSSLCWGKYPPLGRSYKCRENVLH